MINAYGTKTAFYEKPAIANLPAKSDFQNRLPKNGLVENYSQYIAPKPSAYRNLFADRLSAAQLSEDFSKLSAKLHKVVFKSGEVVFQPDGRQNFVYFPETAVFSQLNILEDGRTLETAMIGSEGIAGLSAVLSIGASNVWTQVSIAGSAYAICAEAFRREFSRCVSLQSALLEYVNSYIRQISQRAVCNNHHRIEERFSTWLLMLDDRTATDEKNILALTQEQIAQFLGVHRPSVTCIAQELRNNGIIDYLRGRIFILDRPQLESTACECYRAIH